MVVQEVLDCSFSQDVHEYEALAREHKFVCSETGDLKAASECLFGLLYVI